MRKHIKIKIITTLYAKAYNLKTTNTMKNLSLKLKRKRKP